MAVNRHADLGKERMPVIFVGHGSIEDNQWSRGYTRLRDLLPRPKAILAVSAHWFVKGSYLTANSQPPTIHDFSGFPDALYEIEYPAPGDPVLAQHIRELIGQEHVQLSEDWGLDHGVWSVLHWMYPEADIPVIQLSMDRELDVHGHFALGRSLTSLRDENVLIMTSGNIVHNLHDAFKQMRAGTAITPDWARRFDDDVKQAVIAHDVASLLSLYPGSPDAQLAHPTPEHWLPLLYAMAASDDDDRISFPVEGFDLGSLSMRNILFG